MIPQDRKPVYTDVPSQLRERRQWVVWRDEERSGKPTKIPYAATTGLPASTKDSLTWASFEEALRVYESSSDSYSGLGFVFTAEDPFAGLDLDDCVNVNGEIVPEAKEIIGKLSSYAEISPSGRGVKVFVKGELPDDRGRRTKQVRGFKEFEAYDGGRYFTVTGWRLPDAPATVEDRQEVLGQVCAEYLPKRSRRVAPGASSSVGAQSQSPVADDVALIRARRAANGSKFSSLFDAGDLSEYGGDWSAADLALCSMLAFYTGDPEQIDRLLRRSKLYRGKWDETRGDRTYGQLTIAKALEGRADSNPRATEAPDVGGGGSRIGPSQSTMKIHITAQSRRQHESAANRRRRCSMSTNSLPHHSGGGQGPGHSPRPKAGEDHPTDKTASTFDASGLTRAEIVAAMKALLPPECAKYPYSEVISRALISISGLPSGHRAVLKAVINRLGPKHRCCWPSKKTLAEDAGVSQRTVYDAVRRAQDKGWLGIETRPVSNAIVVNQYHILPALLDAIAARGKSEAKPLGKNCLGARIASGQDSPLPIGKSCLVRGEEQQEKGEEGASPPPSLYNHSALVEPTNPGKANASKNANGSENPNEKVANPVEPTSAHPVKAQRAFPHLEPADLQVPFEELLQLWSPGAVPPARIAVEFGLFFPPGPLGLTAGE